MFRKYLLSIFLLFSFVLISFCKLNAQKMVSSTDSLSSTEKKIYFTIRLGQGGFAEDRSPIGKSGGGQIALDIKPGKFPIAISISNEYYTNSADPTHSYPKFTSKKVKISKNEDKMPLQWFQVQFFVKKANVVTYKFNGCILQKNCFKLSNNIENIL